MTKETTITLYGKNDEYYFKPHSENAKIRKTSKFSSVFKGISGKGNEVIIKALIKELAYDPLEVELFKNETQWFNSHHNIIAPYEYIYQNGRHYLIIEYVPGIDMGIYIKKKRNILQKRVNLALECGLQILDALEFIHHKGIIHADIKPANIMLLKNNKGKIDIAKPEFNLLDFGMIREANMPPPVTNSPKPHFVLRYSPPEQVLNFHNLTSFHSDIHNLALLMYEIIIKEPVYNSAISMLLINLQLSHPISVKKQIPTELMRVLQKATTKPKFTKPHNHYKRSEAYSLVEEAVTKRYQSAEEFRKALLTFRSNCI